MFPIDDRAEVNATRSGETADQRMQPERCTGPHVIDRLVHA